VETVFLAASLPLTKTLTLVEGQIVVAPYPHVTKLTSHYERTDSLEDLHAAIIEHARRANCLFNGQLTRPLVNESRAGFTLKGAKRPWVVFDFDKVDAHTAEDVVQTYLPAECRNVSYIAQQSASMFKADNKQWSGHIFMWLKQPSNESQLKGWFEAINFELPALCEQMRLTDSAASLHWPLDRTAAFDSKLIYIAPPRCIGFKPALEPSNAITLVRKRNKVLTIPAFTPVSKSQIDAKVNELRQKVNLPTRSFDTRRFEDGEVLINAEPSMIHDIKPIGEHYIKFNIGGGDSFGYWIDLRNPHIIKNFKGEPWLKTEEVDEAFFKRLVKTAPKALSKPPLEDGAEILAFYATNKGSEIKTGLWLPVQRQLRLDTSNQTAAAAWLFEYGIVQKGHLPHVDLVFDPTNDVQYIPGTPYINLFRASDYMVKQKSSEKPSTLAELPPVIRKTLYSMLGDEGDGKLVTAFINWLAYIFQTRKKSGIAWVLSGCEGTGKSMFVAKVLRPLFGAQVVHSTLFTVAKTDFNSFLDDKLFLVFEEATLRAVDNGDELMAKLRNWITEEVLDIHAKGQDPVQKRNFANIILNTNQRDPVVITESNRRINVANRQETRLLYTPNEFLVLEREDEIEKFADILHRWPVDEINMRRVVETDDAKLIHEQTTPINALIAEAIRQGDVQFFLDRIPSDAEAAGDFHNRFNPIGLYKNLIDRVVTGNATVLTQEDLYVLFRTLIPDPRYFQDSKTWRMRHFHALGLQVKLMRVPKTGERVRGIRVDWKVPAGAKPTAAKDSTNVIGFTPKRKRK